MWILVLFLRAALAADCVPADCGAHHSCTPSLRAVSCAVQEDPASHCGGPLVRDPSHGVRAGMETQSHENMKAIADQMGVLSADETKLRARLMKEPAFVTHRLRDDLLFNVVNAGGVLSVNASEPARRNHIQVTPPVEDQLYSAFQCVFAAIGTPAGNPRYGSVLLTLKPGLKSWATSASGYFYTDHHKGQSLDQMREGYGRDLYVESDWSEYMADKTILSLRGKPEEERKSLMGKLMSAPSREEMWEDVDQARLAYLESKYDSPLSLDDVESISMPQNLYDDAVTWPEAKAWVTKMHPTP